MRLALSVVCVLGLSAAAPAAAQVGLPRRPPAFALSLSPYVGLAFSGVRVVEQDVNSTACGTAPYCRYKPGSGPMLGADLQVPLVSTLALSVGAAIGRLPRVLCSRDCLSNDKTTEIKGNATLLFRLKPGVPVFFGVGGAAARFDPGPVASDTAREMEYGGVGVIGYDFALAKKVGGRIAWWSYFMGRTLPAGSPRTFTASGLAYDAVVTFGARIAVGK